MMTALAALKERLFGTEHEEACDPHRDPLCGLIEAARESEDDAWQAVNESRERRGAPPIDPERRSLITDALLRARDWEAS